MPYSQCPTCKSLHFFSVDDEAAWYKENYPQVRVGRSIPVLCAACAQLEIDRRHERMKGRSIRRR